MIDQQTERYDATTIVLHWATAVLVLSLWTVGQTADYLPEHSLAQMIVWSSHVTFGFALAAISMFRLFWRSTSGRGLAPADRNPALHIFAKGTHYLLYALLGLTITLGVANAFIRGYDMYHLFHLPQIGDKTLKGSVTDWHGLAADAVLIVAAVHASAALVHHYAWHDRLLDRMAWRGRTAP